MININGWIKTSVEEKYNIDASLEGKSLGLEF